MDFMPFLRQQNAIENPRWYSPGKLSAVLPEMQTWNLDCGKTTESIYHPRARRQDAEPITLRENLLGYRLCFYILYDLPGGRKEKNRRGADGFLRAKALSSRRFNSSRRFSLPWQLPRRHRRRMPPCCTGYYLRLIWQGLAAQKKPVPFGGEVRP